MLLIGLDGFDIGAEGLTEGDADGRVEGGAGRADTGPVVGDGFRIDVEAVEPLLLAVGATEARPAGDFAALVAVAWSDADANFLGGAGGSGRRERRGS